MHLFYRYNIIDSIIYVVDYQFYFRIFNQFFFIYLLCNNFLLNKNKSGIYKYPICYAIVNIIIYHETKLKN